MEKKFSYNRNYKTHKIATGSKLIGPKMKFNISNPQMGRIKKNRKYQISRSSSNPKYFRNLKIKNRRKRTKSQGQRRFEKIEIKNTNVFQNVSRISYKSNYQSFLFLDNIIKLKKPKNRKSSFSLKSELSKIKKKRKFSEIYNRHNSTTEDKEDAFNSSEDKEKGFIFKKKKIRRKKFKKAKKNKEKSKTEKKSPFWIERSDIMVTVKGKLKLPKHLQNNDHNSHNSENLNLSPSHSEKMREARKNKRKKIRKLREIKLRFTDDYDNVNEKEMEKKEGLKLLVDKEELVEMFIHEFDEY